MKKRPVIGIMTAERHDKPHYLLHKGYVEHVERAGGLPVMLAPLSAELADAVLDELDGLIISGGGDIDPALFGEAPDEKLGLAEPGRDIFEPPLLRGAWERNMPIFAVCRGIQILNVVFGGTLWQDVSLYPTAALTHSQSEPENVPTHGVKLVSPHLQKVLGTDSLNVNSYHHQFLKALAPVFDAAAIATDGVIEAIEPNEASAHEGYVLGLQWHPERMGEAGGGDILFAEFVGEAEKYLERK